jgi:hypothetical protein
MHGDPTVVGESDRTSDELVRADLVEASHHDGGAASVALEEREHRPEATGFLSSSDVRAIPSMFGVSGAAGVRLGPLVSRPGIKRREQDLVQASGEVSCFCELLDELLEELELLMGLDRAHRARERLLDLLTLVAAESRVLQPTELSHNLREDLLRPGGPEAFLEADATGRWQGGDQAVTTPDPQARWRVLILTAPPADPRQHTILAADRAARDRIAELSDPARWHHRRWLPIIGSLRLPAGRRSVVGPSGNARDAFYATTSRVETCGCC